MLYTYYTIRRLSGFIYRHYAAVTAIVKAGSRHGCEKRPGWKHTTFLHVRTDSGTVRDRRIKPMISRAICKSTLVGKVDQICCLIFVFLGFEAIAAFRSVALSLL